MITLTFAGHTLSLTAWSRLLGIPRSTLVARFYRYPYLSHAEILGVVETPKQGEDSMDAERRCENDVQLYTSCKDVM